MVVSPYARAAHVVSGERPLTTSAALAYGDTTRKEGWNRWRRLTAAGASPLLQKPVALHPTPSFFADARSRAIPWGAAGVRPPLGARGKSGARPPPLSERRLNRYLKTRHSPKRSGRTAYCVRGSCIR